MISTLPANLNPLPMAVEVVCASLRQQNAMTERQLAAIGQLVRAVGEQTRAHAAGSLVEPLIGPQARAATDIAGGMVDVARLAFGLHARSTAEVLGWWERRLRGSAAESVDVDRKVESPVAAKAAPRGNDGVRPTVVKTAAKKTPVAGATRTSTASRKKTTARRPGVTVPSSAAATRLASAASEPAASGKPRQTAARANEPVAKGSVTRVASGKAATPSRAATAASKPVRATAPAKRRGKRSTD